MSDDFDRDYLDFDLPPVVRFDRRRTPARRLGWRGGRRDADWLDRPGDSLARMARVAKTWNAGRSGHSLRLPMRERPDHTAGGER